MNTEIVAEQRLDLDMWVVKLRSPVGNLQTVCDEHGRPADFRGEDFEAVRRKLSFWSRH